MKNRMLLLAGICGAMLFSCVQQDELTSGAKDKSTDEVTAYIYQERDPNSPLILSMPREQSETRAQAISMDDILGRSFKLDNFPIETMDNVAEPVIDLTKLNADTGWATEIHVHSTVSSSFSYANFDRYDIKSMITDKIFSGWTGVPNLFNDINEEAFAARFASALPANTAHTVFGELDLRFYDARYSMPVRPEYLRRDALADTFRDDLYNLHPSELSSLYGPFVLTDFTTGGRATAFYAGMTEPIVPLAAREQMMDDAIAASYTFGVNTDGSVLLKVGNGATHNDSSANFMQLQTIVQTFGGNYEIATLPQALDDMNIDLTSWVQSLNTSNSTVIDVGNSSLLPLDTLIREVNLRTQYQNDINFPGIKPMMEPELRCYRYYPYRAHLMSGTDIDLQNVIIQKVYLITRFGDAILIRDDLREEEDVVANGGNPKYGNPIAAQDSVSISKLITLKEIFDQLCSVYKIKAEIWNVPPGVYGGRDNMMYYFSTDISNGTTGEQILDGNLNFHFGYALEDKMQKHLDTDTDMLYLLYNRNGKKVGYSIYLGSGDYLLDTYGIRDWVGTLPETTVSDTDLDQYTLIAL